MKNLLPNASFELDFGQARHEWVKYNPGEGAGDNWTDLFNPLTMPIAAGKQVPEARPAIEPAANAPDGQRAAVITAAVAKPGHLTSPVVALKGGHGYTLSVYARSDDPAVRLQMGMWHQPLDWTVPPDAQSEPIQVTKQWQRYELTFVVPSYLHAGLVDLVAVADTDAKLWVDAVQLEQAPRATAFETRLPTEAHITADTYFSGMLHLHGEPLVLNLNTYTGRQADACGDLKLCIETLEGREMLATQVACPASPGRHTTAVSVDFPWVGNFRARVYSAAGECVDVSSYGYMFTVHPVMKAGYGYEEPDAAGNDFQGILYSRDGEVHELPAERYRLPQGRIGSTGNFTITDDHSVYLPASLGTGDGGNHLLRSRDGGRTWDPMKVTRPVTAVLRDGSFLSNSSPQPPVQDAPLSLHRSQDGGQTWHHLGGPAPKYEENVQFGNITQLRDGTLVWPIGFLKRGVNQATYTFRSTDGGVTWSDDSPVCPTGEPAVIELASGRLLAIVRNNMPPRPGAWRAYFDDEHEDQWRLWHMQ